MTDVVEEPRAEGANLLWRCADVRRRQAKLDEAGEVSHDEQAAVSDERETGDDDHPGTDSRARFTHGSSVVREHRESPPRRRREIRIRPRDSMACRGARVTLK